jgi:uncharacterized C2H2 Zn-finger protein
MGSSSQCPNCGKWFMSQQQLSSHSAKQHG